MLSKVIRDMQLALVNPYEPPITIYVFGNENYTRTIDLGFKDVRLIDSKSSVWDMKTQMYRHKIEIWHQALKDYDEIVFLDWDCIPATTIPLNFWDVMGKGPNLKGALYAYHNRKVNWRLEAQRTVIAATFLYFRGKTITQEIIDLWEKLGKPWSEEALLMRYWDEINGGWKGSNYYADHGFEPLYHTLYRSYSKEFIKSRKMVFFHCNRYKIRSFFRGKAKKNVKKKLDDFCRVRSSKMIIGNG